jgi:subfamily B ATP-binding cassette protein MsbA
LLVRDDLGAGMTGTQLYLRLLGHVKPYWRVFALSILGMVIAAATEVALPAAAKPFLDGTFVERDPVLMRWIPFFIVLIFVARGIGTFMGSYASAWVGQRVVMDLRNHMFGRLLQLPQHYYGEHLSGNLISKFSFDVVQVAVAVTHVVTVLVRDSITVAGLLGYLLWLDWKLTLITFATIPPIALTVRAFNRRLRHLTRQTQRSVGEITQVLQESVEGQKVVKIFGGQTYEKGRFGTAVNGVRRLLMKEQAAAAANVPVGQLFAAIAVGVVIYQVTLDVQADRTTIGSFVSFIAAMLLILAPLKRLTSVTEHVQRGLSAAESVFGLIDETPEDDRGKVELGRARGELRFESVTFRYPGSERPALSGVSLHIHPGESIALVGQSGSGKTTFASLIPRFYHPTAGRLLVDGHDIEEITLASLRANVGFVSQDVTLFNDTIAANIAYGGKAGASEAEVLAAAKAAHAWEFIELLPDGLDTLVGENGVKLSGGQRQRLAIARTLLKNAPILVLDEATSALDSESERHVQAGLDALMQGRTTIVIAHRLSTIERADRIVVLDKGEIAEIGTHAELLARSGIYARLHRLQFATGGALQEAD